MKSQMIHDYLEDAYTNNFVFGKSVNSMVYCAVCHGVTSDLLESITTVGTTGHRYKNCASVRFTPNKKQWEIIVKNAEKVFPLCTLEYLEKWGKGHKKNRGEAFEELACKALNGILNTCPNIRFDQGPDFSANGVPYQAKYYRATVVTEETLLNVYNYDMRWFSKRIDRLTEKQMEKFMGKGCPGCPHKENCKKDFNADLCEIFTHWMNDFD